MEALAVSSHLSSVNLSHRIFAFPALAWTTRLSLIGLSHRPSLKCQAAALSSSVSGKQLSSPPSERSSNSICYLVPTVEKEELARFAYAVEMGSNLVPLYRCIFCDHLTPILAYRCLVAEDDIESPSFLFESVEQGLTGISVGRYSVVGAHPAMEIVSKENMVSVVDRVQGLRTEEFVDDPMVIPRRIMEGWSPLFMEELPDVFCGGWLGYFSYDTMRYVEKRRLPFSSAPKDDRNLSDINLGLYNDVIVFDHVEKNSFSMLHGFVPEQPLQLLVIKELLYQTSGNRTVEE